MACQYFENCSGSSKLCKLREKYGSVAPDETKWVSGDRRYKYCESNWRFKECPDFIKRG
jgi:hypothetical protein